MLFLDQKTGEIAFSTPEEQPPEAVWTLFRHDLPLVTLRPSNLSLRYHGPVNRVGGVGQRTLSPWALVTPDGPLPLPCNMAPQWTVPGERTFSVEPDLEAPEQEQVAVYSDQFEGEFVAVQPGSHVHFAAFCALHRAFGRMEIEFYDRQKEPLAEDEDAVLPSLCTKPLDPDKIGGPTILDFDRCHISATVPFAARFAQLRFRKEPASGEGGSFLFFFRPYLGYTPPATDLSVAEAAVARTLLPRLFLECKGRLFLYGCQPPLSIFDGATSSIRVVETLGSRSRTVAAGEIAFPQITGTEILEASDRLIIGRVLADGVSCASIPLALCRPDRRVISKARAIWSQGAFTFEFVVPKDPFDESFRSFSICDTASATKLLDVVLTE